MNRTHLATIGSDRIPLALLALLLSFAFGISPANAQSQRRSAIVRAVENARSSVVNINGHKVVPNSDQYASQGTKRVNGMGTGVVVDPRGYLLTNYHVVEGVRRIQVTLSDGTRFVARLVAHHPETDLAIIKIPVKRRMKVVNFGSSRDIMTGESVVAMGNAYGYEHTVTVGIVSAQHRNVQVNEKQSYFDLIQTDASINPGNSGGPLLNIDGEMIGVNVAVRQGAQGIGFAIPVDQAMQIAARLMSAESLSGVWHGVIHEDSMVGKEPVVVVRNVQQGSPAYQAGIRRGDVIRQVAGREVGRGLDFECAFIGSKIGDSIDCEVKRRNEDVAVTLAVSKAPIKRSNSKKTLEETRMKEPAWDVLGLRLKPATGTRRVTNRFRGGLEVMGVKSRSLAAAEGIQAGDVLVGIHVWETVNLDNIDYILEDAEFGERETVPFYILREAKTFSGSFPVSKLR